MLSKLMTLLSGREPSKSVSFSDIKYLLQKGGGAYIRGFLYVVARFRMPGALMLGRGIKLIDFRNLKYGRGLFIGSYSYIDLSAESKVCIGEGVTIREGAWIQCRSGLNEKAEGLIIGDNVYIGPNSVIGVGGFVKIDDGCQIGARLTISAESHNSVGGDYTCASVSRKGIYIGKHCWIGNNVCILDGVSIGDGVVIGAGTVVTKNIPAHKMAYGVPARIVD